MTLALERHGVPHAIVEVEPRAIREGLNFWVGLERAQEAPNGHCTPHHEHLFVVCESDIDPTLLGTYWHVRPDKLGGVIITGRCS